jgi:hypothetical protein
MITPPEAGYSRKLGRFAIWNRPNRERIAVIIIAMCVWIADVAFLINGKYVFTNYWHTFTKLVIS